MTTVSFEFFPAKTDEHRRRLVDVAASLAELQPSFMSVTYGAGGTTQDRTLTALADLTEAATGIPLAGHLTTVNASKEAVTAVIDRYVELGIRHVVALRGDPPPEQGYGETGYETAADLVTAIRSRADGDAFEISVAAYPEVHPKATSAQADLDSLKQKIDAGADRALTQFFFDPEVFLRFRDRAVAAGIEAPIVPGIMPIVNFAGVSRFAARCGADIPPWLAGRMADLDDDPEVQQAVAATVVVEQCRRLIDGGVTELHFYTMNKRPLPTAAVRAVVGEVAS